MATGNNPAISAFVAQIAKELQFGQVLIRRCVTGGFELRHVSDRERGVETLREIKSNEFRPLTQFTAAGVFRPLKSAPNLQCGWRVLAREEAELEIALNTLYPGAVSDWFAAQSPDPPVTHYREFTARQTGMYRITTLLTDAQAAGVTRACCDANFCLKRRLWTTDGLAPDSAVDKSLIPCLEPCALLLEFARKVTRIEQAEKVKLELSPDEIVTLRTALQTALAHPNPILREADFNAPDNPRRLRLMCEKLAAVLPAGAPDKEE